MSIQASDDGRRAQASMDRSGTSSENCYGSSGRDHDWPSKGRNHQKQGIQSS